MVPDPHTKGPRPGQPRPGQSKRADGRSATLGALVEPIVVSSGLDLEAVNIKSAGRRLIVRIVVDAPGGLSLDRIAELSRRISGELDNSSILGDSAYVLEVTSPGVSRPLTRPRHWVNATGRLVVVATRDGQEVTGRVSVSDDTGVRLELPTGGDLRLEFTDVARAVVQVEFARIAEVELDDEQPDEDADPQDGAADLQDQE